MFIIQVFYTFLIVIICFLSDMYPWMDFTRLASSFGFFIHLLL